MSAILDWLSQIGARPRDSRAMNVLDRAVEAMGGSAALAAFVVERIPIVAPLDAQETIEKAMALRGLTPTIEIVSKQKIFDAGNVRARVYDFGPAPHVAQLLGAYFPDEKLLYVADFMDVLTEELVIAGVDAVPMRKRIRELGLDVQRFVPVHGLPISGEQLEAAYRIRAKYMD